ncbi:MAG: TolC family protein, partial [Acidobacteria bacterium]|nr:TolC family protein [Acidobacteriota bacterium]
AVGPGYENLPSAPFLFRFNLDIPVETARKRGYRIKEAQRVTEASRLALAEMAWKVRARLRAALLDQLLFARELSLLEDQRNLQAEAVSLVRMRLEVGAVSRPVLDLAQFELSGTVLAIRSAEGRLAHARVALAGTLGVPLSALDGYTFAWPDLDQPPGEQLITRFGIQRAGLLNRIGVRRSLVEYAAAEAALQLEVARQYPNLNLNPGYAFDDGENKYTIVPALVLPIFNRNQGPIAQAEARREEAATRFLALQATVINQTETALGDYRAAFGELADADRTLTIQRQRANSAAASLKVGETDRLTLVTAHFQVAAAQMLRLNALRKTQQSLGQLEDAVERPLTGGLPLLPPGSRRP